MRRDLESPSLALNHRLRIKAGHWIPADAFLRGAFATSAGGTAGRLAAFRSCWARAIAPARLAVTTDATVAVLIELPNMVCITPSARETVDADNADATVPA